MGQLRCSMSHGSTQDLWKMCLQPSNNNNINMYIDSIRIETANSPCRADTNTSDLGYLVRPGRSERYMVHFVNGGKQLYVR